VARAVIPFEWLVEKLIFLVSLTAILMVFLILRLSPARPPDCVWGDEQRRPAPGAAGRGSGIKPAGRLAQLPGADAGGVCQHGS